MDIPVISNAVACQNITDVLCPKSEVQQMSILKEKNKHIYIYLYMHTHIFMLTHGDFLEVEVG